MVKLVLDEKGIFVKDIFLNRLKSFVNFFLILHQGDGLLIITIKQQLFNNIFILLISYINLTKFKLIAKISKLDIYYLF